MSRFVVAHGAFEGAYCWASIAERLRAAGHKVQTPDLPGLGEDPTPPAEVTLKMYVDTICDVLRSDDEPAVLVSHSMGGIVATQAAALLPDRVAQHIYVSAFLPKNGGSLLSLAGLPEGSDDGVLRNMAVSGEPAVAILDAESGAEVLYGECEPDVAQEAAARLRPQPMEPFHAPVEIDDNLTIPRRFIVCTKDKAILEKLQRRMIRESPCEEVAEIQTDHSPFFSAPEELTRILLEFASRTLEPVS